MILRRLIYDIINKMRNLKINNIFKIFFIQNTVRLCFLIFPGLKKILSTNNKEILKIVSKKYKFIYHETPLVGSRSFIYFLLVFNNLTLKSFKLYDDKKFKRLNKRYFSFAIIRNPWSRIVSCYNQKILNANNLGKIIMISQYRGLYPKMPFREFIIWLCSKEGSDLYADPHWISQYRIFQNKKIDFFLKLENLNSDFNKLRKKINLDKSHFELPHFGSSILLDNKPFFDSYLKYYENLDTKLLKTIEQRYLKDAISFGYDKLIEYIEKYDKSKS